MKRLFQGGALATFALSCGGSGDAGVGFGDASLAPRLEGGIDASAPEVSTVLRQDATTVDATSVDAADATKPDVVTKEAGPGKDGAGGDGASTEGGAPDALPDAPTAEASSPAKDGGACLASPSQDKDGDGWTIAQGDCNDCDPNVNPGAVDVPQTVGPDGGLTPAVDSDCDGKFDPPAPCDTGLALADLSATDAAHAIELCQFTTETPPTPQQRVWGVISASYVRANGAAFASPALQVGIENGWGPNVSVQAGQNMLALSSGHARTASQSGACGSETCDGAGPGTAPAGFPQDVASCPPSQDINDDVALEVTIRAPTNATGYKFALKFYSMEYPYWVCNSFNDQFIALVSPAPTGSVNGNISFDSQHNPVSVNLGFFDVCDPSQKSHYAGGCFGTCPSPPSPYCPSGPSQLAGTGFDVWEPETTNGTAGATSWLTTQAPVTGGKDVTIRFAIWDTGDDAFDSTVLLDDFEWIATPGVAVSTNGR